jgi:hypothetical protein
VNRQRSKTMIASDPISLKRESSVSKRRDVNRRSKKERGLISKEPRKRHRCLGTAFEAEVQILAAERFM